MNKKALYLLITAISLIIFSGQTLAQSSGSDFRAVQRSVNTKANQNPDKQNYLIGKATFFGERDDIEKFTYCVRVGEVIAKINKGSMKYYNKSTYTNLINNLFVCEEAGVFVANKLEQNDLLFVIHYLNEEYKLKLKKE